GPPGPGAHCPGAPPSTPAQAPAGGADLSAHLWARYQDMRRLVHDLLPPEVCSLLNPAAIYANNKISLRDVEVYGFDYYTLAQYADALHHEIFSAARDILIEHYKYPEGIRKYDYNPSFAIRGLHYDIQKSLLMKIDAFHYVQLGTAYRGLQPVPDEEVIELYGGTQHIPLYQMSGFYGKGPSIKQFMDIFSLLEMALLSCVVDYFLGHSLEFDQAHLYKDVTDAIRDVHVKALMYQWIEQDMRTAWWPMGNSCSSSPTVLSASSSMWSLSRQTSPASSLTGAKPFRKLDEKGSLQWDRITRLEKGKIYGQGNLFDFLRLTEWRGPRVLYFGDHLYSDLADLMLRHGWRTGAIIPELEREIPLTGLLERMQTYQDTESRQVLAAWMKERQELRCITKALFNVQFGSIFRTFHNPTYFSRRLVRFSGLYMASLSCLLNYRVDFTYPRRTPLQHEAPLWMDQLCTGCMKTPFLGDMAHIR
uniref:5'-nucleotidase domain containing 2 n=1 Tax=Rhinopithecus roxellana TaxID=61622 RepID=A0A2K6QQ70_RHIRO